MTGEIRNLVQWKDIASGITEAENKFVECLMQGIPCFLGDAAPTAQEAGPHNTIRGEVIRFFAYDGDEKHRVRGTGIFLSGAFIPDILQLTLLHTHYTLGFFHCRFNRSVYVHRAECANFLADHSHFDAGLIANGLKTSGDVSLQHAVFLNSGVELMGADIGRDLDCRGGIFKKPKQCAIKANNIRVGGHMTLRDNFFAEGEVCLLGGRIGRTLAFTSGVFNNIGGNAINAGQIEVGEDILMDGEFSANGNVDMSVANVGKSIICDKAEFRNKLILQRAKIKDTFLWRNVTGSGIVDLMLAHSNVLADEIESWEPFTVILHEFTYKRLVSPQTVQSRIDWLSRCPADFSFSTNPYEQLAKVLRAMGKDIDAWDIEREKNRLQRKVKGNPPIMKRLGWILDTLKDAVYRPLRTVKWATSIVIFGAVMFAVADYHSNIVPIHSVITLNEDYKRQIAPNGNFSPTHAVRSEYPAFNPLVFSLDLFTPSAVFHQEDFWGPRTGGEVWWISLLLVLTFLWAALALYFAWLVLLSWLGRIEKRKEGLLYGLDPMVIIVLTGLAFSYMGFLNILWLLTLWYWFEIAMGWILTSLFLLSITGLLRPRQSSG